MQKKNLFILLTLWMCIAGAQDFTIARIHYNGGGDWYSDPSSLPNLLSYVTSTTNVKTALQEVRVKIMDKELADYPYLYLTGHGNLRFSDEEAIRLREFLLSGAFLHVDDNYGLDPSFRREIQKVFPEKSLVELPHDHPIFSAYFNFPNGVPKVHEHDGKPPQAFALFDGDRIMVLYTYESDLGDGWEDAEAHNDPWSIREAALKFGVNIVTYALTQ